jgi:hypothetical protein
MAASEWDFDVMANTRWLLPGLEQCYDRKEGRQCYVLYVAVLAV